MQHLKSRSFCNAFDHNLAAAFMIAWSWMHWECRCLFYSLLCIWHTAVGTFYCVWTCLNWLSRVYIYSKWLHSGARTIIAIHKWQWQYIPFIWEALGNKVLSLSFYQTDTLTRKHTYSKYHRLRRLGSIGLACSISHRLVPVKALFRLDLCRSKPWKCVCMWPANQSLFNPVRVARLKWQRSTHFSTFLQKQQMPI